MKMQKGFTLMEVMVAVVIIAILGTFAIPAYQDYVVRGKLLEATAGLADGRIRLEQFYQDNRTYINGDTRCPPASKSFTFTCDTLTDTTFKITANGVGSMADYHYTIDQANARTSTTPFSNNAVAACWVMKKGDGC